MSKANDYEAKLLKQRHAITAFETRHSRLWDEQAEVEYNVVLISVSKSWKWSDIRYILSISVTVAKSSPQGAYYVLYMLFSHYFSFDYCVTDLPTIDQLAGRTDRRTNAHDVLQRVMDTCKKRLPSARERERDRESMLEEDQEFQMRFAHARAFCLHFLRTLTPSHH